MSTAELLVSYPVFVPSQAFLSLSVFQFSGLDSGPSAYTLRGAHPHRCNTPISSLSFLRVGNTTSNHQGGLTTGGLRSHLIHIRQTLLPCSPNTCASAGEVVQGQGRKLEFSAAERMKKGPSCGKQYQQSCGELPAHQPPC